MNEFRIIIYVILLIISIVSLVKNSLKKQENRKKSKETRESLNPIRVITPEELNLINSNYKVKGNIDEHSNVYKIHGEYTLSEIRHRGGSVQTHYIGPHEVYLAPGLSNIITSVTEADVVFTDKNIAVILEVPGLFSINKEVDIHNELNSDPTVSIKTEEKNFEKLSREMTENELNYLNKDLRVFAAILLFVSFIIPIASINTIPIIVSGCLAIISIILYLRPMSTKIRDNNRLVRIRGNIKINDATKSATLDRFLLKIPKHWNIQSMDDAVIEGYAVDENALTIDVLNINNTHSIEREAMYTPIVKKGKLTLLAVLLAINTFIFFVPANVGNDISFLYHRYMSKDLKTVFTGFDEINNFEFQREQRVIFSDFAIVPYRENYEYKLYLIDKDEHFNVDVEPLLERLEQIKSIQNTYYFVQIVALGIDDYYDSRNFINNYDDIINEEEPIDYYSYFKDNPSYAYLVDEYNNLADENYEIDLYELEREFNRFFEIEADYFNDFIDSELGKVRTISDKIQIFGLERFYEFSQYIEGYDLKTFSVEYGDLVNYIPYPTVHNKINDLKSIFLDDYQFEPINGRVFYYNDGADKTLHIYGGSYDYFTLDMVYRSILGIVVALTFLIVLFFTIKKYRVN